MMTIAISSCTEDTQTLGTSLISSADQFVITTDTLPVYTCSVVVMNEGKMIAEMNGKEATQEKIMTEIINSGKTLDLNSENTQE